ncbi:hypothetical protein A3Q56_04594 [Intoshia linei]|uniref:Uncharacterized protein n=1 Tax=Intoshia linei TaxID=1819745 RepID=A0A177B076_9BILA|nr:hypothetical protein A3Q56_04594 [Intoshia linei]
MSVRNNNTGTFNINLNNTCSGCGDKCTNQKKCPAWSIKCDKCNKYSHYSNQCKRRHQTTNK